MPSEVASRNPRGRRAFTLLEVLMALGIFAFAALGLMLALEGALDGARATQRDAEVRNGLANRLDRLTVGPFRSLKDEEEQNGVRYLSEVEREEVMTEQRILLRGFWRVKVTANWIQAGSPQTWSASHLVYRSEE